MIWIIYQVVKTTSLINTSENHTQLYMYHYFYKITNLINECYYVGIHSTENLDDKYAGSGVALRKAYKEFKKENFKKEILKFFDSREELSEYEKQYIKENKCLVDSSCYNIYPGGDAYDIVGHVTLKNALNGKIAIYDKTDEYVIQLRKDGILVPPSKGLTIYRNTITGETEVLQKRSKETALRLEKGEIEPINKGKTTYFNLETGLKEFASTDDPRIKEGILVGHTKGFIPYFNTITGKCECVSIDDSRIKEGILVSPNKNKGQFTEVSTGKRLALLTTSKETKRLLEEGKIVPFSKGKISVYDNENKCYRQVENNKENKEKIKLGIYIRPTAGKACYIDKESGKKLHLDINAEETKRLLNDGKIESVNLNRTTFRNKDGKIISLDVNAEETKTMLESGEITGALKGKIKIIKLSGEKATCYPEEFEEKKKEGWFKGDRIYKCYKDGQEKIILKEDIVNYYEEGWSFDIKNIRMIRLDKVRVMVSLNKIRNRLQKGWTYHKE